MLNNKHLFVTFMSVAISALPIGVASAGKLSIKPDSSGWSYIGAEITINDTAHHAVNNGITIPVVKDDRVKLTVIAMNARPRMADTCQHIKINDNDDHDLIFKLEPDWLVHCYYA